MEKWSLPDKLKLPILIILFSLCAVLHAQREFHLSYDHNMTGDGGRGIIETTDNGFLTFGDFVSSGIHTRFAKVDSNGTIDFDKNYLIPSGILNGGGIWENGYYGYGDHFNSIEGAGDGHILFINNNGDSLKTLFLNLEFNERLEDAILLQDSTFILLGRYADTANTDVKPYVARVDTLGNVIWFKTHNTANNIQETVRNIESTPDGGYIIGGVEEESPNWHTDLFLLKVDSVGNQEWKYKYHEPLSQRTGFVQVLSAGSFALFGTGYDAQGAQRAILKIDSAGNLIWRKKHGVLSLDEGYIVGRELPNGNFICAGTSIRMFNGQPIDDINLSMLDSAGNQIWSRDYSLHGADFNQYVNDMKVTSDGGFVLTGFILNAPNGRRNDIFILKTDENGILTSLNNGFVEVKNELSIYPNPTKGQITLSNLQNITEIQVFNLQGQKLVSIKGVELKQKQLSFDLQYPQGLYLIKTIDQDGNINTQKVIKQ